MSDSEKINLLIVTLMRAECLMGDEKALRLWWKDAEAAIREVLNE